MITHLPADVQAGLDAARKLAARKSGRLRVVVDDTAYRVLRTWPGGFALNAADAPPRRGLVDLYEGGRHLSRCLVVALGEENGEIAFDYKLSTDASGEQPLDFHRAPDAPAALIEKDG
ncbi:hypothetical protein D6850_07215 [Roseovarius spongiae]|uniref:Uncharacterized protein n=1 Tax=Roseovarius spongiae TaxID=2320272 RepID=A0A3A8B5E1_9RHOB|nr:hypothetical protein [Roseovarius spongiae]RKF14666.1 hypothetical protein D6850_07215 [Roseovarius spongiae]